MLLSPPPCTANRDNPRGGIYDCRQHCGPERLVYIIRFVVDRDVRVPARQDPVRDRIVPAHLGFDIHPRAGGTMSFTGFPRNIVVFVSESYPSSYAVSVIGPDNRVDSDRCRIPHRSPGQKPVRWSRIPSAVDGFFTAQMYGVALIASATGFPFHAVTESPDRSRQLQRHSRSRGSSR
jgi:hypothetical protein